MKTFTKLSLVLLGLIMYSSVHAQNLYFNAGANLSSFSGFDFSEDELTQKWKPGFHLGFGVDYNFSQELSLQSGLRLSTRGTRLEAKYEEEIDGVMESYSENFQVNIVYAELPLAMRYRIALNKNVGFFMQSGIYLGVAIAGSYKFEYEYQGEKESYTEPMDWDDSEYRVDLGLTIGAGIDVKKFQAGIYYDHGFRSGFDYGMANRNLRLSLGYRIFSAK